MAIKTTQHTSNKDIDFTLIRKQVKNIGLKVKNTGVVQVTANSRVPLEYIITLVDDKSEWIHKHQEKFRINEDIEKLNAPLTYSTGEVVYFLGEKYILNVVESTTSKVYVENNILFLNVIKEASVEKKQQMLEKWYREQCAKVFNEVLDFQFESVKEYITHNKLKEKPFCKLRKMKSCWGVCHYTKGYIVLNTELIKYDMECINYVVLHELIHFRHPNHGKEFYDCVGYFMPNYKEVKGRLKNKH